MIFGNNPDQLVDHLLTSILCRILASQLLISPDGKKLILLEVADSRLVARITVYTIDDGKIFAEVRTDLRAKGRQFELSLCPADEDVVCLLTSETVNLYRAIPGQLMLFSSVKVSGGVVLVSIKKIMMQ